MQFYLVSLGCPKNEVDADNMAQLLHEAGHIVVEDPSEADILIVNTCGFISKAREESLGASRELGLQKRDDQRLIAAGCFSQLYREHLLDLVPALDGLLGTRRWMEIDQLVEALEGAPESSSPLVVLDDPSPEAIAQVKGRVLRGDSLATAYLRIADGCNAPCAFCSIPQIKGPLQSRPVADILREARHLVDRGAKELVIIAQDTTAYGQDRGERDALPDLLTEILRTVPELSWLRLMYAYPQNVTSRLISTMAEDPRICHYLDLPLQHAHPETLRRMRRPHHVDQVRELLWSVRQAMPDIALRTSLIVGYPGETEEEFAALLDFVEGTAFDKVGVFVYSQEAGTLAHDLPDQTPEALKEERYNRLMALQQDISRERHQAQVGRTLDVLVEGTGEGLGIGRSYRDAPQVDGLVIFRGEPPIGEFVPVRITEGSEYDLTGTWLRRHSKRTPHSKGRMVSQQPR